MGEPDFLIAPVTRDDGNEELTSRLDKGSGPAANWPVIPKLKILGQSPDEPGLALHRIIATWSRARRRNRTILFPQITLMPATAERLPSHGLGLPHQSSLQFG